MTTKIDGLFVMDGYRGLRQHDGPKNLISGLQQLYDNGDLLDVTITVKKVGKRPICEARTAYSRRCSEVMNVDGTCPDAESHVTEEAEVTA